jgi:hypothetical protein
MPRKPKAESTSRKRSNAAEEIAAENAQPSASTSSTAVATEAMRTGVVPLVATTASRTDTTHRGDSRLKAGDIESSAMDAATVGDEAPGGSTATPDQDRVDDIGRALGVQEVDSGELRTTSELLDERDRHRAQQEGPDPTTRD